MTPQEKAKELIEKFKYEIESQNNHYLRYSQPIKLPPIEYVKYAAKRCADICVDEIIVTLIKLFPEWEKNTYWHPIDFWQQVKQSINEQR